MRNIKLVLRILVLPVIAIPVIILYWLTFTLVGLTVIAGFIGFLFFPLCWLMENHEGMEDCREVMGIAVAGIAYPFLWLWCFVFNIEELKDML